MIHVLQQVSAEPIQTDITLQPLSNISSKNLPAVTNSTEDFNVYENASFGISAQYPTNWTAEEEQDFYNDGFIDIVSLESPLLGRLDESIERVLLSIDTLPNRSLTLEQYAKDVVNFYNNSFIDFRLVELSTNRTLADNHTAYRIVFTNTEDDISFKTMEMGTIIGNRVYLVTYAASQGNYPVYLPIVEKIITSFRIMSNNTSY